MKEIATDMIITDEGNSHRLHRFTLMKRFAQKQFCDNHFFCENLCDHHFFCEYLCNLWLLLSSVLISLSV